MDNLQIQPIMKKKPLRPHQAGTLCSLSVSMHASTRTIASTGLYASVYNNINIVFKVAEQVVGRISMHNCCKIWSKLTRCRETHRKMAPALPYGLYGMPKSRICKLLTSQNRSTTHLPSLLMTSLRTQSKKPSSTSV
jgi:hypothetical protein